MVPDCVTIMQTKTTIKEIVIANMRSIQWFPNRCFCLILLKLNKRV